MDRGRALIGVLGGLVSGLAVMAFSVAVMRTLMTKPSPPAPTIPSGPAKVKVVVRSTVASAHLHVDGELCGIGKCEIEVKPGSHEAEVRQPGYAGESREFVAKAGLEVELTPQPLPSVIEITGDLVRGEVQLDAKPPVPLGAGGAQIGVEPGEHRLRVTSGALTANFKFEAQTGMPPRLLAPPTSTGLRVIVVAGAGPDGRLWSTEKNAELAIGPRELGLVPEEGIALPSMERGVHRFVLKPRSGPQQSFVYELAENPTAWISLRSNRAIGTLRIVTAAAADDAKVIVDGKDTGARIRRGRAVLPAVPGAHEVGLEKAGFISPAEQRVSIKDGGEAEITFKLDPVPTRALLPIAGAPPGAAITIDDKPAGMVGVDGTAVIGDLNPGAHVVTAKQAGYVAGRWEVKLGAGRNTPLNAAMQRSPGTLRIVVTPAGVEPRLTLRRLGQFEERDVTGREMQLAEGEYTATAMGVGGERVTQRVRIEAGKDSVVTLAMTGFAPAPVAPAKPTPVPPPPAPSAPAKQLSLSDWDGAPGWTKEGDSIVNEGGGIMLAPTRASAQSLTFTARARRGKAVRWVTQFRDASHFTLYELRGDSLNRIDVVGGKWITRKHASFKGGQADPVRIRMNQQEGALHTSAFVGGNWVDLDTVESPNGTGRFGFYVPDRESIAVSEFRYEYR